MQKLLTGLNGVVCLIDDVLVFATDEEEHSYDKRLIAILEKLAKYGTTLNPDKCFFKQQVLKFLRHVLNKDGVSPDPEKTEAIRSILPPTGIPELRCFLGMANELGKFSHRLANLTKHLSL